MMIAYMKYNQITVKTFHLEKINISFQNDVFYVYVRINMAPLDVEIFFTLLSCTSSQM